MIRADAAPATETHGQTVLQRVVGQALRFTASDVTAEQKAKDAAAALK